MVRFVLLALVATAAVAAASSPVVQTVEEKLPTERRELGFFDLDSFSKGLGDLMNAANQIAEQMTKAALETFNNSDKLKKLGSDLASASKKMLELSKNELDQQLKDLTGKDLTALASDMAKQLEAGAKKSKADLEKMVEKLKDSDAFGKVSDWTGAIFKQMGEMVEAVKASDITQFTADAVKGGIKDLSKVMSKAGAFAKDQMDAWGPKIEEAFGKAKDFTEAKMKEIGAMAATIDWKELKADAIKGLEGAAIKIKGAADMATSWSMDQLKALSADAKKFINGKTLKDFRAALKGTAQEVRDKIKEVLNCGTACPGAVVDVEISHAIGEAAADIKKRVDTALSGLKTGVSEVLTTTQTAATATSRRRLSAGGDAVTTVRVTTDTNADAAAAAAKVQAAVTGASVSTIPVTASDNVSNGIGRATPVAAALSAVIVAAVAVAL